MNENELRDTEVIQGLILDVDSVGERVNKAWKVINDLANKIFDLRVGFEKHQRQCAELRNQSLTTVESVNEYMNAFQLSHYIPSHPKPSTIRVWCCQGKIPHHKMNGKLVFVKSEIDEWLKSKLWEK